MRTRPVQEPRAQPPHPSTLPPVYCSFYSGTEAFIVLLSDFLQVKGIAFGLIDFLTAGCPTKHRWALPDIELGAMESSNLNFFFNRKMCAAKSGSMGDILAA